MTTHHYWHNDAKTDLSKIRDDAARRLRDKRFPEESVVHKHPRENPDDCLIGDARSYRDLDTHEIFVFEDLEKDSGQAY